MLPREDIIDPTSGMALAENMPAPPPPPPPPPKPPE
jgi:hypothetical protein